MNLNVKIAQLIYEKHCPKVVKELVGEEKMLKRLEPIVNNLITSYDKAAEKALQCYKTTYTDDPEDSDNCLTNEEHFTFVGFSASKFVKTCKKQSKNKYCKFQYWQPCGKVGVGNKFSDSNVTTFLYEKMKDCFYPIHHCLYLDDVCTKLGYELRDLSYSPDISDLIITVLRIYAKHQVEKLYDVGGEKYLASKDKVENM